MVKKGAIVYTLGLVYACSAQLPSESTLIIHDNARVVFTRALSLFERMEVGLEGTGKIVCDQDAQFRFYVRDDSTRFAAIESLLNALHTSVSTLSTSSATCAELQTMQETLTQVQQQTKQLMLFLNAGSTMPVDESIHVLCAKIALLDEKIAQVQSVTQAALKNIPLITAVSDTNGLSVLAPFLKPMPVQNRATPSQDVPGTVGTRLSRSVQLPHDVAMVIDRSMVIDGQGESLSFAASENAQFIIKKGARLRLENIRLLNVHAVSFLLEEGSFLVFGDDVVCEFAESWTLSAGTLVCDGMYSVVRWNGMCGAVTVTLTGSAALAVNSHTLALSRVTLCGADRISCVQQKVDGALMCGAVALCGDAHLVCDDDCQVAVVISGLCNTISFTRSLCLFKGPLFFVGQSDGQCGLRVVDAQAERPVLRVGEYGMLVANAQAHAQLDALNEKIWLQLEGEAPLVIGVNGTFHAYDGEVTGAPVVDVTPECPLAAKSSVTLEKGWSAMVPSSYPCERVTAFNVTRHPLTACASEEVMVHNVRVSMPRMKRAVIVEGAQITDWGVDGSGSLALQLREGSVLEQGRDAVMLKSCDMVSVQGYNRMICTGTCAWRGALSVADGGVLRIEVAAGATLYWAPRAWELGAGARCEFSGKGTVICNDSSVCMGPENAYAVAASVVFEGVKATVLAGVTLTLARQLSLRLDSAASFEVQTGGRVWCGLTAAGGKKEYSYEVIVDRGSTVALGLDAVGGSARFSCGQGVFALRCLRGGCIAIGKSGIFECCMRDGALLPGTCAECECSYGGNLWLSDENSVLWWGSNMQDAPCRLIQRQGGVWGCGLIGCSTPSRVLGRCQKKDMPTDVSCITGTARLCVASMINCCDRLSSTLYFVTQDGSYLVQTVTGALVSLQANEWVESDDALSGSVFCKQTTTQNGQSVTRPFVLRASGSRSDR